jgi:hypothetical protein
MLSPHVGHCTALLAVRHPGLRVSLVDRSPGSDDVAEALRPGNSKLLQLDYIRLSPTRVTEGVLRLMSPGHLMIPAGSYCRARQLFARRLRPTLRPDDSLTTGWLAL